MKRFALFIFCLLTITISCRKDFGTSGIDFSFGDDIFEAINRGVEDYATSKDISLCIKISLQEPENIDSKIEKEYNIPVSRFQKSDGKYNYKAYFDRHPVILSDSIKSHRFYTGNITILLVSTLEEKTIFYGTIPEISTERTKTQIDVVDNEYYSRTDNNLKFSLSLKKSEDSHPLLNKKITCSTNSNLPLYLNYQDIQFEVAFENPDTNLEDKIGWPTVEFAIKDGNTFKPVTIGTRESRNPISGSFTGFLIDELQQNPSKGLYRIKVSFTTNENITTSRFLYFSVEDYFWLPYDTDIFLYDYPSKKIHPSKFTGATGFAYNDNQTACSAGSDIADFVYQNKNPEKNAYNIFYLDVNGNIRQFNCKTSGSNSGTDSICYTSTSDNKFNKLYYDYETDTLYALKTSDGTIAAFTPNNDIYSAGLSFTEKSYGNSFFETVKSSNRNSELQIQDFAVCDDNIYMVTKTTAANNTQFFISTGKISDNSISHNKTMNIIDTAKKNSSIHFVYEDHKELMNFTDILSFKNTNTGGDTVYFLIKQSGTALVPETYYMTGTNIANSTYRMHIYSCGYALKAEISDSKINFEKEFGNNKTIINRTQSISVDEEINQQIVDSNWLFYTIRNPVEDLKALYGPEKFIGMKNDTIYIADSGLLLRSVLTVKKYKNKRYVVPLSTDDLTLNYNSLAYYCKVCQDGGYNTNGIYVPFETQVKSESVTFTATCSEDGTEKEGSFIAG
ncbi:MAG: hypothetical protein IKX23_06270 [Treponema sp.]|nr:hypothetical protein [Treponema sp.]